ncbi:DUF87 domain-containing protein [Candidatus Woesearchaeota archaeon]|nr:DUF87 domain-containing protein [Candidatus Woesearchaeota archaeon]MCF7901552.1 DUF87 domain-containing protein [Candidatus Woesearchaeota archaeon]
MIKKIEEIKEKIFTKLGKDENDLTNFNLQTEYKGKIIKTRTLLTLTMLVIILAIGIIGSYTGYVSYSHEGKGGYLHEMAIEYRQPAWNWGAIYGAAFGVGVTQPWQFNIAPAGMEEANVFFECFEVGIDHELYASLVPQAEIDINSLEPATTDDINQMIGIDVSNYDSADITFTNTMSIEIGPTVINNIPATYTYVGNGTNVTAFDVGILKDGNGNIVIVSHVFSTLTKGFSDRYYNFQMLLPLTNGNTTSYYIWSDPYDICIGGSQNPQISGIVAGNVTDISGNPIEDVIVVVGKKSTATDEFGLYNLTAEVGEKFIIAIKEGYQVYQSIVNVTENEIVYHNIVLELETTPNQFTDIGPSFDTGVDSAGTETETDIGPGDVPFQIEYPQVIEGADYVIPISRIYRKLRVGEFSQETLTILSYKAGTAEIDVLLQGNVTKLTQQNTNKLIIPSKSDGKVLFTFFANNTPGTYNGTINLTGDIVASIPVTIEILQKEKVPIQALLLGLSAPDKTLYSGSTFTFRNDLTNLLTDQSYPVQILYTIQSMDGKETVWTHNTNVFLKTSLSIIKNVELPSNLPIGDYVLRVTAKYLDLTSSTSYVFEVKLPFYQYVLFGKVRLWHAVLSLLLLLGIIFAIITIRKKMEANKKYHLVVDMKEMPKGGPRDFRVGKIAETQNKAYFNLENFKTHAIVAGSTGGGKSFSAQVIIEEMLLKDVAVIVFDPTAQWTGMLRKLENKGLLALYPNFGMDPKKDAKSFKGNIRQINDPLEIVDVRNYMKPGEIQIFACHKLAPKDIDVFVANTVRQVFKAAFDESEPLRLELVYDEVHRLLPKFGGSGEGFLQIERACREFRKWGLGVMLISQVLADFMGQIKANINTEVQMRTRDEGDLDRIKTKYGEDVLRSLVKASVGTGMCQNAAYNRGRPFFVTFRPIMHSVARLSDEEIEQYNTANDKVDQMSYELEQLEEAKQDVFDLKLELKLALDKVKAGNFNMANIYLEGIQPRINKLFEKLGQKPKKLVREKADAAEMKAELEKMKAEKAKENPEDSKKAEKIKAMKPEERFKEDVLPEQIFHLKNDMLVVNPKSLLTEIQAMKDKDFEAEIKDNSFAKWFREAVNDEELAALIEQESEKEPIIKLLELREKKQKLPKLVLKKKDESEDEESEDKDKKTSDEDKKKAFEEMSKDPENKEKIEDKEKESEKNTNKSKEESKIEEKEKEKENKNDKEIKNKEPEDEESEEKISEDKDGKTSDEDKKKAFDEMSKDPENKDKKEDNKKESEKDTDKSKGESKIEEKEKEKENKNDKEEKKDVKEEEKSKESIEPQKPEKVFEELSKKPNEEDIKNTKKEENQKENIKQNKLDTKKECSPDKYFRLENGKELKSIEDLKTYVNEMPDDIFSHHVTNDRNDFANWIEHVFEEKELAGKLNQTHDKGGLEEVLQSV